MYIIYSKIYLGVGLLWLIDMFFHIINYIIISLVHQGHERSIAAWYTIIRQKKAIRLTSARVAKSGIFEKFIMGNLGIYFTKNAFEKFKLSLGTNNKLFP